MRGKSHLIHLTQSTYRGPTPNSQHIRSRIMSDYHLRRKDKEITDRDVIAEILSAGKFASMALCRDDEPYLVTLSYGHDREKKALYFHCAKEGRKIDFLKANARASAMVLEDRGYRKGECDHAYRSVVLHGEIHVVEDLDEKKHAMEVLLHHLEEDPDPIRERNLKSDEAYIST